MEDRKQSPFKNYFSDFYKNFLMKAGPAEPVLVITKRYSFHGCTGFGYEPRPRDYTLDTTIWFGVLPEAEPFAEIANNGQTLKILTEQSVCWSGNQERPKLQTQPIVIGLLQTLGKDLNQSLHSPDQELKYLQTDEEKNGRKKTDLPLEIIVGHEKIQKFLFGLIKYWTEDMYWIEFYLKSIRMSGLTNVKLDPKIQKYEERKKEEIVKKLMRLVESNDLKTVKKLVQEAIELGMHETPWIKTLPERPGISINVPEFIKGFAETLQIPLEDESKS